MKRSVFFIVMMLYPLLFFAQSILLDQALGEENAAMVEAQMGIYNDEEKTASSLRVLTKEEKRSFKIKS